MCRKLWLKPPQIIQDKELIITQEKAESRKCKNFVAIKKMILLKIFESL